jgi:hypothetical protein
VDSGSAVHEDLVKAGNADMVILVGTLGGSKDEEEEQQPLEAKHHRSRYVGGCFYHQVPFAVRKRMSVEDWRS